MIEVDKPYVVQMQMALFFPGQIPDIFDSLSYQLRNQFKEIFVDNALIIPAPAGTPPEIPRFQLVSPDSMFQVVATKLRLDFYYNLPTPAMYAEVETVFLDWAKKIVDIIFGLSISLLRIGVSGKYFISIDNPSEKISQRLIVGTIKNLRELEVRLNVARQESNYEINDIYHFQVADFSDNSSDKSTPGIAVLRDFNNIIDGRLFTNESAKEFLSAAKNALEVDGWIKPVPGNEVQ